MTVTYVEIKITSLVATVVPLPATTVNVFILDEDYDW